MRIFKVFLVLVALAAPMVSASAQEGGDAAAAPAVSTSLSRDQGWNAGSWALLFDLNNFFVQERWLNEFSGLGVGAEYFIDSKMALRVGATYSYASHPYRVNKNTVETGGQDPVVTYTAPEPAFSPSGPTQVGPTSTSDFRARVDFLYRFLPGAVAPYAGAGVFFKWHNDAIDYKDDTTTVDKVYRVHDYNREVGGGVRGMLGAEWRLHPSFSLFAEYSFDVTLVSTESRVTNHTTEVTAGGGRTVSREKNERKNPAWLGANTALTHAGQLGLAIHF